MLGFGWRFVVVAAQIVSVASAPLAGCSKAPAPTEGRGATGPILSSGAVGSSSAATGSATVIASARSSAGATASTYGGTYTLALGTVYVPAAKDWASVKFKNDETKMLGEGTLSLAVDEHGHVTGATEGGPLGASVLDGTSDGRTLTAAIRRKNATDDGLTGTLVATISPTSIEGTMKLSESNAAVVRVGTVSAARK